MTLECILRSIFWLIEKFGPPILSALLLIHWISKSVETFKLGRDLTNRTVDYLFELLDNGFDEVVAYHCWVGGKPPKDQIQIEQRLLWIQEKIATALADLKRPLFQDDFLAVGIVLDDLVDSLTGGDFQVHGRKPEVQKLAEYRNAATRIRELVSDRMRNHLAQGQK